MMSWFHRLSRIELEPKARDSDARCAFCNRRGTWALLTDKSGQISRYCWRCWSRAHRESLARDKQELLELFSPGGLDKLLERDGQVPRSHVNLQLRAAWHWILSPMTHRQLRRHQRWMRDIARKSP